MPRPWAGVVALAASVAAGAVAAGLAVGVREPSSQEAAAVEEVAPGVYLFSYEAHRSLFVVTAEGVVATDPQSPERAVAYRKAIAAVTDAPIRYIIYSHHHPDHVAGADVLRGGRPVPIVANVRTREALAAGGYPEVVAPDLTFDDDLSLHLGELTIRCLYLGRSETDNNIVVLVPEREVLYAVDNVTVRALPWRDMADGYPLEWIETLRRIEALDFEILAPGHGPVGTREDVVALRGYMEALRDAVQAAIDAGADLEEAQRRVALPEYADWQRYREHLSLNVSGMFRALTEGLPR